MTISECRKMAIEIEPNSFGKYSDRNYRNKKYYQAMVLFLYGTFNGIHDIDKLQMTSKINRSTIESVVNNLSEARIWEDGKANIEWNEDNEHGEFGLMMEIVLCSMCAAGELRRVTVSEYPLPAIILPTPAFMLLPLLQEVKQIQQQRESKPYEFKTYN